MKILIKGYYGFGNLGDDILMIVSYNILKQKFPDAEYFIFSNYSQNLPNYTNILGYNTYIKKLTCQDVQIIDWTFEGNFDLVFNGGGGIYFDYSKGGLKFSFLNALLSNLRFATITWIDALVRGSVRKPHKLSYFKRIGLGLGIGPFSSSSTLMYSKLAELGSYDFLAVRDPLSFDFLKDRIDGDRIELSSDMAFLDHFWKLTFEKQIRSRSIGFVLMDWSGDTGYFFKQIADVSKILKARGYDVWFFSLDKNHDKRYPSYFEGEPNFITWDPYTFSLEDFLHIFASMQLVISARAHGAILSSAWGIPSICLKISQKLGTVAHMLKNSSILVEPPFEPAEVLAAVEKVFGDYESYSSRTQLDYKNNKSVIEKTLNHLYQEVL
jgi:polysaccharide pyruvyl transferase WcaK-like protein